VKSKALAHKKATFSTASTRSGPRHPDFAVTQNIAELSFERDVKWSNLVHCDFLRGGVMKRRQFIAVLGAIAVARP
jgi:hypothetical protein